MIGISGVATSGKDTLFILLQKFFKDHGLKMKRFALADSLKEDLAPFVEEKLNLNIFKLSPDEKELIRPILVSYGKIKRINSNGRFWIERLQKLNEFNQKNIIPVVTDIRYQEYPKDECSWLKEENNGILIHISRFCKGKMILPANLEEDKNNKILIDRADYAFSWCTEKNIDKLYEDYKDNFKEIYELYRRRF